MTEYATREHYAEALMELRDRCVIDGRSWQTEIITLICAWSEANGAMGGPTLPLLPPEPDPGELTPAQAILAHTRRAHTSRDCKGAAAAASTPTLSPPMSLPSPTADGPGRMTSPRPHLQRGSHPKTPHGGDLWDYLRDGGPPLRFRIPPGSRTLQVRCSDISQACSTHRLATSAQHDRLTITRVLRP